MELRRYLAIVQRAWWLVLGVPILVLLVSLVGFGPAPERHRTTAKFVVTQDDPNKVEGPQPGLDTYTSWQSSQFIVDDLPVIIRTQRFAQAVADWNQREQGIALEPGMIQSTFIVEREHRIITLIIDAPNAPTAQQIIDGSLAVLQTEGLALWNRSTDAGLAIEVLEKQTTPAALNRWTQPITRLVLRAMLGVVAGIGLAFLWHYLDQTVRESGDLRHLDVPLLTVIPKES